MVKAWMLELAFVAAALLGVLGWRAWWRKRHPIVSNEQKDAQAPIVGINGRSFRLRAPTGLHLGDPGGPWRASCHVDLVANHDDGVFLKERHEEGLPMPFFVEAAGGGWCGVARLVDLQFYDNPFAPRQLVASFCAIGEGELRNV